MMLWTDEAEELLGAAPAFVRKQIREKAEIRARQERRKEIDAGLIKSMQTGGGHPGKRDPDPRITSDPIHEAFDRKYGVHANMTGGDALAGDPEKHFFQTLEKTIRPDVSTMAYFHIPFCCTRCLFCGFYSETTEPGAIASYSEALAKDIVLTGSRLRETGRKLGAVYFGGGTPTDLKAEELELLVQTVRREFPLEPDCEITVEGRLFDFDDEKVKAVLNAGANRFSFGVQSFDTKIRRSMGRILSREDLIERLNRIVMLGDSYDAAVVIDLIYGLPGQSAQEWIESIDCGVNETEIHGLDLYQINLLPATPLAEKLDFLPPMADLKQQADLFMAGRQRMMKHGFDRLSIAHWGRDARERNRYNLWNKLNVDCVPMGAGAGGRWGGTRFFQQSDVHRFGQVISEGGKPLVSAASEPFCAALIAAAVGQIEQGEIDVEALERVAEKPVRDHLRPMLSLWESAGLLQAGKPCRLTPAGEFWSVNLQYLFSHKLKEICA
ncbi:heme anaerobic degradation radical SAM methyltransferase ChuW/HutW [Pontiellaceae bacterium B12219]|nr:heme anaerobic degradation radical SAM methyltransferase ChuW/HutW [Pontiellaceae bacterium B12219]